MNLFGSPAEILTVSQLTRAIRRAVRDALPGAVTIRGEIANLSRQPSGHVYFSLRDEGSSLRCAMFRGANRLLRFRPENGMEVEARGEVNVYVPRGEVQLVVEEMHPAGLGAQMAALEALKATLAAEGLLAPERKRALPVLPRRVGLVTSPRGAAIRDLLEILGRRAPGVGIIVAPTLVQGAQAEGEIAAALNRLGASGLVDVVIVARGGGSLEDLWAFNTEPVARAIAACPVPVVSGVGHETDVTLADLVADLRAATPSHAAELVVPEAAELAERLWSRAERLAGLTSGRLAREGMRLEALAHSYVLRRPARLVLDDAQRLDELWSDLVRSLRHRVELAASELAARPERLTVALGQAHRTAARELEVRRQQLERTRGTILPRRASHLEGLAGRLRALGPNQVLGRGYVLARRGTTGQALATAAEVAVGEHLRLDWADGHAGALVESVQFSTISPAGPADTPTERNNDGQEESGQTQNP